MYICKYTLYTITRHEDSMSILQYKKHETHFPHKDAVGARGERLARTSPEERGIGKELSRILTKMPGGVPSTPSLPLVTYSEWPATLPPPPPLESFFSPPPSSSSPSPSSLFPPPCSVCLLPRPLPKVPILLHLLSSAPGTDINSFCFLLLLLLFLCIDSCVFFFFSCLDNYSLRFFLFRFSAIRKSCRWHLTACFTLPLAPRCVMTALTHHLAKGYQSRTTGNRLNWDPQLTYWVMIKQLLHLLPNTHVCI